MHAAEGRVTHAVLLNDFCHVQGGASKVAIDEAVALAARGVDVTFLGAVGPIAPELRDAPLRVVCLDQPELADAAHAPRAAFQALWNRRACGATQDTLASLDPATSIVHLHGYTKALSAAPMLAARRAGFATLCTLHDFFAACPNGAFFDYRRAEPCALRALSPACLARNCDKRHPAHKAYRVVRGLAQRHLARFPASVHDYITLSRRSAELLTPYLPPRARLHPLANPIDVTRGPPIAVAANTAMVVLGRLDEEKGVRLAAQAAANAGLPLTFIGDGPLRPELEALGARVTGWLPAAGVDAELRRARCLLFPSLWYEAFGLVVAEAAARGIPAIVSDISAAAERVRHGVTGWIVPAGDAAALARALRATADDAAIAAAGTRAWRDFWAVPSDRDSHAAALLAIYAAVLAGAAARPSPSRGSNAAIAAAS